MLPEVICLSSFDVDFRHESSVDPPDDAVVHRRQARDGAVALAAPRGTQLSVEQVSPIEKFVQSNASRLF